MSKNILITEEKLNYIINEELGIAKKVSELSEKLKKQLFYQIEKNDNNSFEFEDIKVVYNVYRFSNHESFYTWFDNNPTKYINGYSYHKKTLFLTIININNRFNIASLNDIIQHELEHYYQSKMAGHSFGTTSYNNAYLKYYDFNAYIKHISRIEYFSKHFEIDGWVNGAFFAAKELEITDYNSFIELTDLKEIKSSLKNAYNFFKNIDFDGMFFDEMLLFIKKNNYYRNCGDLKKLRNKICEKCKKTYQYFIKKSSRAFALLQLEKENKLKINSDLNFNKFKIYKNN